MSTSLLRINPGLANEEVQVIKGVAHQLTTNLTVGWTTPFKAPALEGFNGDTKVCGGIGFVDIAYDRGDGWVHRTLRLHVSSEPA